MKYFNQLMLAIFFMMSVNGLGAAELPIIDAHSQADQHIEFDEIIKVMDEARVSRAILTLRGSRQPEELAAFASRHPDRIIAAVRTKGYMSGGGKYFKQMFVKQMLMPQFRALGEVLLWHEEKTAVTVIRGDGTMGPPPKVVFSPDHPRVQGVLSAAIKKGWPFVAHIEFRNIPTVAEFNEFMNKFEIMLRRNPDHPFLLNNMGYLEANQVRRLIESHPNIYFIPSWSNPIAAKGKHGQRFVNMFKKNSLSLEWRDLIVRHPERFVLGLDNIMANQWGSFYVRQIALWRQALNKLPAHVAHAVAHTNAERLWRLPPTR